MKLFKEGSFADEIANNMVNEVKERTIEQEYGISRLAKAVDNLNVAAEILEDAGMEVYAEEIIAILEKLASIKNG